MVHINTPPSLSDDNSFYLARMLSRHRRLLHDLEPMFCRSDPTDLSQAKLLQSGAYDHALSQLWLGFRGSSSWHALPRPNSQWISSVTKRGQKIYYDVLTGQLLVDGKQLGRLPQEIVKHPTYAGILGAVGDKSFFPLFPFPVFLMLFQRTFSVVPADVPGMDYMTRSAASGYQVRHWSPQAFCRDFDHEKILFSWQNKDLVLQARKPGDSQRLQFIPRSKLLGDFPRYLVDKYVHWLDLRTHELEFRPAGSPWTSETSNWRLYIQNRGMKPRATLQKLGQGVSSIRLIDIHSSTFSVVSKLLSPLEYPDQIMATHIAQTLEISLPRLRLSFFVNSNWELECRSIPGYVIDETQTCGTMFGLTNKLVLRPSLSSTSSDVALLPRRIIIPKGNISFKTTSHFANVSIDTGAEDNVRWHEYTVDTDLGCLTGTTSLSSKLYQCYLHALTSHCLPDPLLGHTGTEEALHILQSAACRSFQRLDVHEAELLEFIGKLTPNREFYPHHLRSMATVKWNDLPALSQHHDFFQIVCTIYDHARDLEVLYDPPAVFDPPNRNPSLLNRAASRNNKYYPSDIQALERSSSPDDIIYRSRDLSDLGTTEHVAFQMSWSIWNGRPSFGSLSPSLWDLMNSWGSVGPSISVVSLRYSRYWLSFDAPRDWFVIYDLCRSATNEDERNSKIKLCFSLSAAAYSKSKYKDLIPFLTVVALDVRFRDLSPPRERSFMLSDGVAPRLANLEDLISQSAQPIYSTPVYSLQIKKKRKTAEYNATISRESSIVARSILNQWPHYHRVEFPELWFNKSDFIGHLVPYIQSIARNVKLEEHVAQLQSIMPQYVNNLIPAVGPYVFSPQVITSKPGAPSYSLHDLMVSCANVPTPSTDGELYQSCINHTTAAEAVPQLASSPGLDTLIEEFRNSRRPLLKLYGGELNKSHLELLGQPAHQLVRGAVPQHELLLAYHHECSRVKDKIFSRIKEALAPSRTVEETNSVAGLWPRMTPRSLLRQLARDRINTIPDKWRPLITRFATALLKYRHSRRLLELSSKQRCEELHREIEAIHNNILAESTPDWLLVQVRPFC